MNARNEHRMKAAALGLLVALAGTASATAHARSVPGHQGVSRSPAHCFFDYGGSIQNRGTTDPSCAEAEIRFPLTMDHAGRVTATIHAFAPDAQHNISCRGQGMTNGDGGWVLWEPSPSVSLDTFGAGDVISISWNVPAHGAAFVECKVRPGSWINVVEW